MMGPDAFDALVRGKRVVLVGPAGYLEGQGRGAWIDGFDLVVKMNWGETLPDEDYGRTDVLFKRMLKLGHLDDQLLRDYEEAGIRWIVAAETRPNAQRKKTIAGRLDGRIKWHLDDKTRPQLLNEFRSAPLLGSIAVRVLLEHRPAVLQLVGIDFYASGYSPDYGGKDYRREMRRREGHIGGRHDGPEQLQWLIRQREANPEIVFDDALEALAASSRPARTDVIIAPRRKKDKKRRPAAVPPAKASPSRFVWHPLNVSSTKPAQAMIRTYIEHRQTRQLVEEWGNFETIAEIGAGFGRMGALLVDLAPHVTLYEREPELVRLARRLLPQAEVVEVPKLDQLPGEDQQFDLVLTFTCLQHLSEAHARAAAGEAGRMARLFVLIVEDTDPAYRMRDRKDQTHFTDGRPAEWYGDALGPAWELVRREDREVEPGYSGPNGHKTAGEYLLFRRIS